MLTLRRIQELVSAQPVEEGAQERVRTHHHFQPIPPTIWMTIRDLRGWMVDGVVVADEDPRAQYQEAEDQQIPVAQRHRPEVQEKPQTCAPRYNEGTGTFGTSTGYTFVMSEKGGLTTATDGSEGWQA